MPICKRPGLVQESLTDRPRHLSKFAETLLDLCESLNEMLGHFIHIKAARRPLINELPYGGGQGGQVYRERHR